jgi:uncharacterized protein YggE
MKRIILFLSIVLLASSAFAAVDSLPFLSVSGAGTVQIEPDRASLRLGVEVIRKSAREAQFEDAREMQAVIAAIRKQGITKDNIQTTGFNIWQENKFTQNEAPKVVGYHCSNQIIVTIDDLSKVSSLIDRSIAAGADNVQGIQFSLKDDSHVKKQALEKAVKDAMDKAKTIAGAAGVKLKELKEISESTALSPLIREGAGMRAMAINSNETPVSPGLIEVKGNVIINYSIE